MCKTKPIHGFCYSNCKEAMAQETISRFEAPFPDPRSGIVYTTTFHLGEPCLYHPPHKPTPVATHVTQITRDYFTCGDSTTERMIPLRMASKVLTKLSLPDIEIAIKCSSDMTFGEKMFWQKYFDNENMRLQGKQRICAPCCGRIVKRFYLEEVSTGVWTCPKCKFGDWGQDCVDGWRSEYVKEQAYEKSPEVTTPPPNESAVKNESETECRGEWPTEKRRRLSMDNGVIVSWDLHYGFFYMYN